MKILYLLLLLPVLAKAELTVMAINAEWLWSPADGRIDGEKVRVKEPSLKHYHEELAHYAMMIVDNNVDLLALAEIEGAHVANDLREHLPPGWQVAFRPGKDSATGQDVAIITRLKIEPGSITDFRFPRGYLPGDKKGKMLTKVLGLRVEHPDLGGQRIAVVTAHLLSRRNDSKGKARKRLKQAVALAQATDDLQKQAEAVIVLGDLNDLPDSRVISHLRDSIGLLDVAGDCDVKGARRSQVDYVLYRGLRCKQSKYIKIAPFSDHPAVLARFY